jgi:hypothetical protein
MHWSCIDEIVIGFKLGEEFYPSLPLGVDSADTSQLPKEKNFHGQFQYYQITQPGTAVVPLHLCTNRGGKVKNLLRKSSTIFF